MAKSVLGGKNLHMDAQRLKVLIGGGGGGGCCGTPLAVGFYIECGTTSRRLVHSTAFQLDGGGNARGAYSVDLQQTRTSANEVASSEYCILWGDSNRVYDYDVDRTSDFSFVGGGGHNILKGSTSSFVMGDDNEIIHSADYSILASYYNFILGSSNYIGDVNLTNPYDTDGHHSENMIVGTDNALGWDVDEEVGGDTYNCLIFGWGNMILTDTVYAFGVGSATTNSTDNYGALLLSAIGNWHTGQSQLRFQQFGTVTNYGIDGTWNTIWYYDKVIQANAYWGGRVWITGATIRSVGEFFQLYIDFIATTDGSKNVTILGQTVTYVYRDQTDLVYQVAGVGDNLEIQVKWNGAGVYPPGGVDSIYHAWHFQVNDGLTFTS